MFRRIGVVVSAIVVSGLFTVGIVAVPNASAATTGSISGKVVGNSVGVPGVCVSVYGQSSGSTFSATTGSDGSYTISGLATDDYLVFFDPSCAGVVSSTYAWQYFSAKTDPYSSNLIPVASGSVVPNINATLTAGSQISGTVTANGGGVGGTCIYFYLSSDWALVAQTTSQAGSGSYDLGSFPGGSYFVEFDPTCNDSQSSSFAIQFYQTIGDPTRPLVVGTSPPTSTSGIGAALIAGSSISGIVTVPNAANAAYVCVLAYALDGDFLNLAFTDASGAYDISNLPVGSFRVRFDPSCIGLNTTDFAPSWYSGAASFGAGANVTLATPGATQPNINETLGLAVAPLSIATSSLPSGTASSGYSTNVLATGGSGPYDWVATGLPAGLSINAASGTISGTTTSSGTFNVSITVTDASTPPLQTTTTLSVIITSPVVAVVPTIAATTTTIAPATRPLSSKLVCSIKTKRVTVRTSELKNGKKVTVVTHKTVRVYKTVTIRKVEKIHGKKVVVVTHKSETVRVCKTVTV